MERFLLVEGGPTWGLAIDELIADVRYEAPSERLVPIEKLGECISKTLMETKPPKGQYEFIDLFAGAGGLSLGMEAVGFRPKLALDADTAAMTTYRMNRPFMSADTCVVADIKQEMADRYFDYAPVVVGGPPCQGFSNANKQPIESDPRNSLYKFFLKYVADAKPEIFVMENVRGLSRVLPQVAKSFSNHGYLIESRLINAAEYGVPQNRERLFLFGMKRDYSNLPISQLLDEMLCEGRKAPRVLSDALFGMPHIEAKRVRNATGLESDAWGGTCFNYEAPTTDYLRKLNGSRRVGFIFNHKSKYNNDRDREIYSLMQPGDRSDSPRIAHLNPYGSRNEIFKDKFFKLRGDAACKTMTAHMYYDCHMYIHPEQARGLSPREAARVQGFPDHYIFFGFPNEWYRQIGNAVSPVVGRLIGRIVCRLLDEIFRV